jgi:hypothetical protein
VIRLEATPELLKRHARPWLNALSNNAVDLLDGVKLKAWNADFKFPALATRLSNVSEDWENEQST